MMTWRMMVGMVSMRQEVMSMGMEGIVSTLLSPCLGPAARDVMFEATQW